MADISFSQPGAGLTINTETSLPDVSTTPALLTREQDLKKGPPFDYEGNWDLWNEEQEGPDSSDDRAPALIQGDAAISPEIDSQPSVPPFLVDPIRGEGSQVILGSPEIIAVPDAANLSIRVTPLPKGTYQYEAVLDGGKKVIDISEGGWMISPEKFEAGLSQPWLVKSIRRAIEKKGGIVYDEERESWVETVSSGIQKGVSFIPGMPAWIGNSLLSVPDIFVNLGDWALEGFPSDHPIAKGQFKRHLSQPEGEYLGSPEQFAELSQNLGDHAGAARRFINEATGTVSIPIIKQEIGLGNFLSMLEFDTTPQQRDKGQQYLTLLGEILGAAPIEGLALGRLMYKLSTVPGSVSKEKLLNEMTSYEYSLGGKGFWDPRTWAGTRAETGMGGVAGAGMIGAMELGENAPEWAQQWIALGGAFLAPPLTSTAGRLTVGYGAQVPLAKLGVGVLRGVYEAVHPSGMQLAATRALENIGGDRVTGSDILDVREHLFLAIAQGNNMDKQSFITYTTPQFARREAATIDARLKDPKATFSEAERARLTELLPKLRRFADFQEGQFVRIFGDPKIAAEVYADQAQRLLQRRDKLFDSLGKILYTGDTVHPVSLSPEQIKLADKAFRTAVEGSIKSAKQRIKILNQGRPKKFASEQDRLDFDEMIRREAQASQMEASAYVKTMYANIPGFNVPKNSDILIDGMPIGEYYAAKISPENLQPGQRKDLPSVVYELSGSQRVKDQPLANVEDNAAVIRYRAEIQRLKTNRQTQIDTNLAREQDRFADAKAERTKIGRRKPSPKQKRDLAAAEKRVAAASKALDGVRTRIANADSNILKQENLLDKLYLDKVIDTPEGSRTVGQVTERDGILDVRTGEDGQPVGWSAADLDYVLSGVKRSLRGENSRIPKNAPKIAQLNKVISELEGALADNFDLDPTWLEAARNVAAFQADTFGSGPIAQILAKGRGGGAKVQLEETASTILPQGEAQRASLRQLQSAMTRLRTGENTPVVRGEKTQDNPSGLEINPALTQDAEIAASILARYAERPPPPFEPLATTQDRTGVSRGTGYKVAQGTPETPENINIVEGILWDRFSRLYDAKSGLDFNAARQFVTKNENAITWLEKAKNRGGATDGPQGAWDFQAEWRSPLRDLTAAEDTVRMLNQLDPGNIDNVIRDMREAGVFKDNPYLTEDSLRVVLEEAATKQKNLAAFKVFTDGTNIQLQGDAFLDSVLKSDRPDQVIDEVLHVLKQGELEDGTNPSLQGFKDIISHAIHSRIRTSGDDNTVVGKISERLNAHLATTAGGGEIKLYDYTKLRSLLDPDKPLGVRFRTLLDKVYGGSAWQKANGDVTPSDYFSKFANSAAEHQVIISEAALKNIEVQTKLSNELIGNLGRMAGLYFSKTGLINALVASGIGRRAAVAVADNMRQSGVERLIYEGLVDPEFAMLLMKKHGKLTDAERGSFLERIAKITKQQAWDKNLTRIKNKLEDSPGAFFELIKQATSPESTLHAPPETLEDQRNNRGLGIYDPRYDPRKGLPGSSPEASLQERRNAAAVRLGRTMPVQSSVLSRVNPVGPDPQTAARGQQVFGAMDPIFSGPMTAAKGGIASIKPKKPRQMVI